MIFLISLFVSCSFLIFWFPYKTTYQVYQGLHLRLLKSLELIPGLPELQVH